MTAIDSFINGVFFALGTVIVSTVFGFIIFKYSKNWITKTIAEIWKTIKEEGLHLDGLKVEGKLETKKKKGKQ